MFRQYREFESSEFIVVGVDTAAGGTDYCSAVFLSKTYLDVPLVYHEKVVASQMTPKIFNVLERIYDTVQIQPTVAYERNNGGVFELERLAGLNRGGKYQIYTMPTYGSKDDLDKVPSEAKKIGWDTNSATRPKMIGDLKEAVDGKMIKFWDKQLIEEMFSFIVVQTTTTWRAQAEKGAHDDLIMALAIAWQLQQSESPPVQSYGPSSPVYRHQVEQRKRKYRLGD